MAWHLSGRANLMTIKSILNGDDEVRSVRAHANAAFSYALYIHTRTQAALIYSVMRSHTPHIANTEATMAKAYQFNDP